MKKALNFSVLLVLVCSIEADAFSLKGKKLLFLLTNGTDRKSTRLNSSHYS